MSSQIQIIKIFYYKLFMYVFQKLVKNATSWHIDH